MLPLGNNSRIAVLALPRSPCSWMGQGDAVSQGSQVCLCLQACPGYCRSLELPQLLLLPGCALVSLGVSVFTAFILKHPHGLAYPQLWLCLLLVCVKFPFFSLLSISWQSIFSLIHPFATVCILELLIRCCQLPLGLIYTICLFLLQFFPFIPSQDNFELKTPSFMIADL